MKEGEYTHMPDMLKNVSKSSEKLIMWGEGIQFFNIL